MMECSYDLLLLFIFKQFIVTNIQVCSSAFVNATWTTFLYGYGSKANGYSQLDRPLLSKQHQIMSRICAITRTTVDQAISNFIATTFMSSLILSRDSFVSQASLIIGQFIEQLPVTFRRMAPLMTEVMATNLFVSAFNTDWLIEYGNDTNDYLLRNIPRLFTNGTCNCVVSNSCQELMRIGPPGLTLPGLVVGCWPIHGLRMSTLECFYSSSCINTIISYLDYYTLIDGSPPVNFTLPSELAISIAALDNLIPSRFSPNTSIGTLIDELFLEQWSNTSSYEDYFKACAPSFCSYTYIQRNDALFAITSVLGLYGGLTVCLRFIAWNFIRFYRKIRYSPRIHQIKVEPRLSVVSS